MSSKTTSKEKAVTVTNSEHPVKKVSTSEAQLAKVDSELGLVFGFAIVSTLDGQPYFDLHDDHIPEDTMLKAAADFMEHSRVAKDMHAKGDSIDGKVVFAFPLTSEIAKALEIETKTTGLLVALKPSPEVLEKFKDGTYTGFSIGGDYGEVELVE
jgi:hypothetical protein